MSLVMTLKVTYITVWQEVNVIFFIVLEFRYQLLWVLAEVDEEKMRPAEY